MGLAMSAAPLLKRAIVFVDGQNLFHAAKEAFGYTHPNYDVRCLLKEIRFYTGVPDVSANPRWNYFWTAKLASMGKQGIKVFSRPLRYRERMDPSYDRCGRVFPVRSVLHHWLAK